MRVVMVEAHHLIEMPGFELRTFQCVGCGDVEKRPCFDSERVQRRPTLVPEPDASHAPQTAQHEAASEAVPVSGSRMRALFGSIARLRAKPSEI
jgi:hypothetical protein